MKNYVSITLVLASVALLAGCPSKPKEQPPVAQTPTTSDTSGMDTSGVTSDETAIQGPSGELLSKRIVYFDFDRADIRADAGPVLEGQSGWLSHYPSVRVRIEGNCDERGTREYNFALGARRADAVRDFLVAHGVAAARITPISYGKEQPIDPGSTEEAHAQNRNAKTAIVSGAR